MISKVETITDWDRIEQILELFDKSFPRPLSERVGSLKDYAKKLSESAVVDIVSLENNIAGFSAYYCNDSVSKQAFLTQIAVADACRGMNIGNILLNTCIETSKQKGMEKLICEVDNINVGAILFYKKRGFTFLKKASEDSQLLIKYL